MRVAIYGNLDFDHTALDALQQQVKPLLMDERLAKPRWGSSFPSQSILCIINNHSVLLILQGDGEGTSQVRTYEIILDFSDPGMERRREAAEDALREGAWRSDLDVLLVALPDRGWANAQLACIRQVREGLYEYRRHAGAA